MISALGDELRKHRASCPQCAAQQPCTPYLNIAREWTARRQIRSGSRAACFILTVRENP